MSRKKSKRPSYGYERATRWEFFNPPTCKQCGKPATVFVIADGACGDPDCCSQTEHPEFFCLNEECSELRSDS